MFEIGCPEDQTRSNVLFFNYFIFLQMLEVIFILVVPRFQGTWVKRERSVSMKTRAGGGEVCCIHDIAM